MLAASGLVLSWFLFIALGLAAFSTFWYSVGLFGYQLYKKNAQ
jgi:hypothetical protein